MKKLFICNNHYMEKMSEALEEKFSTLMCDYEKTLTLIKLLKEMQYEDNNFAKKDLQNITCILYEQAKMTYDKLKETEKFLSE